MKKEIVRRVTAPTPQFFKTIRKIGIALGAMGGALLAAPVALPVLVTSIAGYMVAAGLVASAVSSTAVDQAQKTE